MFIGIRFNKGNFECDSNPNIARPISTRRRVGIPTLGRSSREQSTLEFMLPIPKQLTLESTPPIPK